MQAVERQRDVLLPLLLEGGGGGGPLRITEAKREEESRATSSRWS